MRVPLSTIAAALGATLLLAAPAAAAPNGAPVRFWSVHKVVQGAGEVPVQSGAQLGDELFKSVRTGRVVFNLPLPTPYWENLPRDDAFGSLFSSADGKRYSVLATAPAPNPLRAGSPKGTITHLDEYQAYEKQSDDASLKITISGLLLNLVDANASAGQPLHAIVRFHARAYAASQGGDFFTAGGLAYLQGRERAWKPGAATSADSPRPLWDSRRFTVDGDADNSDTGSEAEMFLTNPRTLRVPLGSVRRGELFAVHVSLEAEAVNDRGGESAAQAAVQDPQHGGRVLLTPHGLTPRGKPRFKEPAVAASRPAKCARRRPRHAGVLQLSDAAYAANESERAPLVLVTRSGGSRGPASVTLAAHAGTAQSGSDFRRTSTTVRFGAGDAGPRLVEIPLREDATTEPAEAFTVALGHARCGRLGPRHRATVTIVDDDQPAPPVPAPASAPPHPPAPTLPVPSGGFDSLGRVSTPVGAGHGEAVVIQRAGGIVTAGRRNLNASIDFALTRHDAGGKLDPTFGTGGIATTDLGGLDDEAFDAALLPDDGIVAVGRTDAAGVADADFGVVRYLPGGTADPGFGTRGIVKTDIFGGDQANAVAVQPDGRIVVAGFADRDNIDGDFALVRYMPNGTPDESFGTHGIVTTDLGTRSDDARAVVIQPDGHIAVAGTAEDDVALVRYTAGGEPETRTITPLASEAVATGVALTPTGDIVVAGFTLGAHVDRDFLLLRYDAAGALDTAFGPVTTDLGAGDDFAENVAVDPDGRIVLVGRATSTTITDMALVRYLPDGTPDMIRTVDFHARGDFGQDVTFDAAGTIVAVGYTANGGDTEFALFRGTQ